MASPTSPNAEASSSRTWPPPPPLHLSLAPSSTIRGRSESRKHSRKGKERETNNEGSLRVASDCASPILPSTSPARDINLTSSTSRRVRTVPPSAVFEPPTPPPVDSPHDPLPSVPTIGSTVGTMRHKRYPTYYSDSDAESDDEDNSSDEEPPWWTFTQKGMAKLRHKTLKLQKGESATAGDATLTEGESAKEDGEKKVKRRPSYFSASRRNSIRDKEGGTPSSNRRRSTHSPSRLFNHRQAPPSVKIPSTQIFRRSSKFDSDDNQTNTRPKIIRVDSAPARPTSQPDSTIAEVPSPGMTTLVDEPSVRLPSIEGQAQSMPEPPVSPRRAARRQLTAPAFPRFFRPRETLEEGEPLTDTENQSLRTRPRSMYTVVSVPEHPDESYTTPDASPSRPKYKRKPSHRLRLNIPPPITQHFANNFSNGWPHAGSWQDALYGYYVEPDKMDKDARRAARRKSSRGLADGSVREQVEQPERAEQVEQGEQGGPSSPGAHEADVESSGEAPLSAVSSQSMRKGTKRKQKRFQAMVPPTPSGLGFTPKPSTAGLEEYPWDNTPLGQQSLTKEGTVQGGGFNWAAGDGKKEKQAGQHPTFEAATAKEMNGTKTQQTGYPHPLSRQQTSISETNSTSEEGTDSTRRLTGWRCFGGRDTKRSDLNLSWRKRTKRMLFLDARVTIWIRLVNLAVVFVALGLAISIRRNLIHLKVPGVIGSSTTLILSYSSTTIFHNLTAVYREYFGKPIGLWGLRSKMLWVCLDLLFVALWSSAMSLAINDLIATPLECSPGAAWWRVGLADDYAILLESLAAESTNALTNGTMNSLYGITSATDITSSIGVTLPSSVIESHMARQVCRWQAGCIALSLLALLLYGGNMVLSLFRIFETVRRTANVSRAVIV